MKTHGDAAVLCTFAITMYVGICLPIWVCVCVSVLYLGEGSEHFVMGLLLLLLYIIYLLKIYLCMCVCVYVHHTRGITIIITMNDPPDFKSAGLDSSNDMRWR